ncbi:MAG TPA: M1 family aminopeptidase [Terriglobales bacterium]|nr:M1 family aminopeptidase [Terriglobales bacterium]
MLVLAGSSAAAQSSSPAAALYRKLHDVGLDSTKVYRIRDATFDREDLHFAFNDGWLILGQQIEGHVTSAFFVGDGDILLIPPNLDERSSLALFTGEAVLEEKFTSAYLRFFDDKLIDDLSPWLHEGTNPDLFATSNSAAQELARTDALRLLMAYVNAPADAEHPVRFLHARVSGIKHGIFDIFYDQAASEQISVGQIQHSEGGLPFYNVWTSFRSRSHRESVAEATHLPLTARKFTIKTTVHPPDAIDGDVTIDLEASQANTRGVLFELSRFLKVSSVTMNGRPVEFLQNEAVEGSRIARDGNDFVSVVLPHAPEAGKPFQLRFVYSGSVLSDAGGGLLYVGARGTWYPNLGLSMAMFDLQFRCPDEWTLVATGRQVSTAESNGEQITHWISDHPIPVAGFNLGHYRESSVQAGQTTVESFNASGVERAFPSVAPPPLSPTLVPGREDRHQALAPPLLPPRPAGEAVANEAAATIDYLSSRIGAFPYPTLALTQMPGDLSQGWPGMIFLSSFVFVPDQQRGPRANSDFNRVLFDKLMVPHETAHQWWGDSVYWASYRDQWLSEALANYCAMMEFENDSPKDFRTVLEFYRSHLAEKGPEGRQNREAGPVTLGYRLNSSIFPGGYELIAYGRGTWLIHMLREFLRDGTREHGKQGSDDLFFSALKSLQHDLAGKQMSTHDFEQAFERVLPKSLDYEGKPSLEWFFEGWVNGTAMPKYRLANVHIDRKARSSRATAKLLQEDAPDDLVTSVPIYAELGKGNLEFLERVFADGNETTISVRVPEGTRKLVVDPHNTVLTEP